MKRGLVWGLVALLAGVAGVVVWVRDGEPVRPVPVVATTPAQPPAPPKTAGRRSEPPDPGLLSAARLLMGGAARVERCGPYALLTDVADPRLLAACARLAEPLDALFAARYGVRPLGVPGETIVLFARLETFRVFTREQGLPAGYAGFAVGARGIAVFYASDQPLATFLSTLTHELSHLVSRRALGSDLPPWLSEGLADGIGDTAAEEGFRPLGTRAGGDVMAGRLREAYASRRAGSLERLARLRSGELDRGTVVFDYEQSALLVRFLLADSELAPRFRGFLGSLAAGERYTPEGFIAALGLGWAELDRRFAGWLASTATGDTWLNNSGRAVSLSRSGRHPAGLRLCHKGAAMKRYTLDEKPETLVEMRKRSTVRVAYSKEPFEVETQEGRMVISPETVDDWDPKDGYAVAYPSDGSKPYAIAPRYLLNNYELTSPAQSAG